MSEFFSGYRIDLERRDDLAAMSAAAVVELGTFATPEKIDPRGILKTENQANMGSCQGHALSTCLEWCHYLATGGQMRQLSRLFAYLGSQKIDGINGDSGSTLSGGAKLAMEYGVPPEEVAPYPRPVSYPRGGWRSLSAEAWEAAKGFRIATAKQLETVDATFQWLASGAGLVEIGIGWNGSTRPDSNNVIDDYRPGGGGHAVVIGGYLPVASLQFRPRTRSERIYLLHNSHGEDWGKNGWAYVTEEAIDQMLGHRWTVFMGLSDMFTVRPRAVDFSKDSVIG